MRQVDVCRPVPKVCVASYAFLQLDLEIYTLYPPLSTQPVQIWLIIQWDSQIPRDQGVSYLTVDTSLYTLLPMTADVFVTLVS